MIWRKVPMPIRQRLRRLVPGSLIDRLTLVGAPHRNFTPAEEITVVGFHRGISGLASSVRLCTSALEAAGFRVRRLDVCSIFNVKESFQNGERLRQRSPALKGVVIVHLNPPELLGLIRLVGHGYFKSCKVIGYWAWELERAPRDWERAARWVDEIWALSSFSSQAFQQISSGRPIRVVHPPVWAHASKPAPPNAVAGPFTFLVSFDSRSSEARKNPSGAIEAFKRAFPSPSLDQRLIVKCAAAEYDTMAQPRLARLADGRSDIFFCYDELDDGAMSILVSHSDVVVSLHRAEGFGLLPAEAIRAGRPVIATDYSGNLDFMSEDGAFLIPFRKRLVSSFPGPYAQHRGTYWAEPDLDAAADAMRVARIDAALVAKKVKAAEIRLNAVLGADLWFASTGLTPNLRAPITG